MKQSQSLMSTSAIVLDWSAKTLGLSLLQLWTAILFGLLIGKPVRFSDVIVGGGLIFFANSLCFAVAQECWRRLNYASLAERESLEAKITTKVVPLTSLWLSVIVYCAVLVKDAEKQQTQVDIYQLLYLPIVIFQMVLVILALSYSVWYSFRTTRDLERFTSP